MCNLCPGSRRARRSRCMPGKLIVAGDNVVAADVYRHIEINPDAHANMFFWHFENKHIADKQRTVIWLNGGPGCSSMDGALMEVGPYRLTPNGTLYYNEGSWNEYANLLFLDQPVGTGFSYADTDKYMHELDETADQMVVFLTKFFELFPHYEPDDVCVCWFAIIADFLALHCR